MSSDNVIITENILLTLGNISLHVHCAKECKTDPRCLSFIHSPDHSCLLYPARFDETASTSPSVGSRYFSSPPDDTGDCPWNYVLFESANLCVKFDVTEYTYYSADTYCRETGDRVVSVDSAEKDTAIFEYIKATYPSKTFFVGVTDIGSTDLWRYANSNPVVYYNFDEGEPVDNASEDDCAVMDPITGLWRTDLCSVAHSVICEKQLP